MTSKVTFKLDQGEDAFPPISIEMLNATDMGDCLFQIKNAPFFVSDVSYDDVVRASPTEVPGQYQFEEVVEQSSYTALSIIILDPSMDGLLMDLLRGFDCVIEYGEFGVYRVLGVAVPSATDYASLRTQLLTLETKELISFSELALACSREWRY